MMMSEPMPNAQQMQQGTQRPAQAVPANARAQKRLATLVIAAKKIVFDKAMSAKLMQMVQAAPDPVIGIVQALRALVPEIGKKFGGVDDATSAILAAYVTAMLIELCVAAGIVPRDPRAIQVVTKAVADGFKGGGEEAPVQAPAKPQAPQPGQEAMAGQGMVSEAMEG